MQDLNKIVDFLHSHNVPVMITDNSVMACFRYVAADGTVGWDIDHITSAHQARVSLGY